MAEAGGQHERANLVKEAVERLGGISRLGFLTRTSLGAAALGVAGAGGLPVLTAAAGSSEAEAPDVSEETLAAPLVAHVGDVASGEVTVMSGLRELTVRDPQLVWRLLRALEP